MISKRLISQIRNHFILEWGGIHGVSHWARVRRNGLLLSEATGANPLVVELFAFLHDSCRENDGHDPYHGKRAAAFAESLYGSAIQLPLKDMSLLLEACETHTHGEVSDNETIQTCWDADRLDLGRVGIKPDPNRLCTESARDPQMLEWAYRKSINA